MQQCLKGLDGNVLTMYSFFFFFIIIVFILFHKLHFHLGDSIHTQILPLNFALKEKEHKII